MRATIVVLVLSIVVENVAMVPGYAARMRRTPPPPCPVLEALQVPLTLSMRLQADGITRSLPFTEGVAYNITSIGTGLYGCVYGLVWEGTTVAAVKTAKIAANDLAESEIEALRRIGEHYGNVRTKAVVRGGYLDEERLWIFMKYFHGVKLQETRGWLKYVKEPDKSSEECKMLMFAAGNKMYEVYLHYLSSYGVANMDVGSHNVLFDQDWDKIGPGALIDWGIYETGDASKPPDWGISWYTPHRLIAHLEYMCN